MVWRHHYGCRWSVTVSESGASPPGGAVGQLLWSLRNLNLLGKLIQSAITSGYTYSIADTGWFPTQESWVCWHWAKKLRNASFCQIFTPINSILRWYLHFHRHTVFSESLNLRFYQITWELFEIGGTYKIDARLDVRRSWSGQNVNKSTCFLGSPKHHLRSV